MKLLGRKISMSLGRRGAALIVFSIVFWVYGVLLWINVPIEDPSETLEVILSIANMRTWGFVWVAASVIALFQAFGRYRDTAWAFASLSFVSGIWAAGYLAGWVVMEAPRDPRGWLSGVLWVAVFSLTVILAGWEEHDRGAS